MDDTINDPSRDDAAERDKAQHTLSAEETSVLFAEAGVPRSVRTIQRYCKNKHLTYTSVDMELGEKFLIDRNSVERRIKELQQLDRVLRSTGDATRREETRHDAAERDTSRHDGSKDATEKIAKLEEDIKDFKLNKIVDDKVKSELRQQNERLINQFGKLHERIGSLKSELLALKPGKPEETSSSDLHNAKGNAVHYMPASGTEQEGEEGGTEDTLRV